MKVLLLVILLATSVAALELPAPLQNIEPVDEVTAQTRWNFDNLQYHRRRLYSGDAKINLARLTLKPASDTLDLTATSTVTIDATVVEVEGSGGAVTMTSALPDGSDDGQILILIGASDTNTVTFQHGAAYNTNMDQGQNFTLGDNDVLGFIWRNTNSFWDELFRKNNG